MSTGVLIGNRYHLLEQVPEAVPRILWRARDEWSGQRVTAARVPMPGLREKEIPRAREGLSREVRAAADCRNRHIARPMDTVLDGDDFWVISEPGPAFTLATALTRRGPVEPVQAARWGRDIADALSVAHTAGVLHRDLHAGVVGLARDGSAVVAGFAATVVTRDGLREGIPVYLAPEVIDGGQPSPASDVYVLAALLYHTVAGSGSFSSSWPRMLPDSGAAGPRAASYLLDLLAEMLHPDPRQRPCALVVRDLLTAIDQMGAGSGPVRRSEHLEPPTAPPELGSDLRCSPIRVR